MSLLDLKRLESYSNNLMDFYLIRDLIPSIARLFFCKQLDSKVRLSYSQCGGLLGFGLQHREIEDVAREFNMEVGQCLALFTKTVKKIVKNLREAFEREAREEFALREAKAQKVFNPLKVSDPGVEEEGKKAIKRIEDTNLAKRATEKGGDKLVKKVKKGGLDERLAVGLDHADIDPAAVTKGTFVVKKKH